MKEYLRVLDLASRGALPDQIDDRSDPPFDLVRELVEAGYLWAIDASSFDGNAYVSPRITLLGREYLARLRADRMADRSSNQAQPQPLQHVEPTGWARVDRTVIEIRRRLADASTEEQFQAVGLLCREVIISLAQEVYDPDRHPPLDGTKPSGTDAKRMLDAYLAVELGGQTHEAARRHAKAAYDLATGLQHRRTANYRDAAMCVEATGSVVSVIAIVSGHRRQR